MNGNFFSFFSLDGKRSFSIHIKSYFLFFYGMHVEYTIKPSKKILGTCCKSNLKEAHIWDGRGGNECTWVFWVFKKKIKQFWLPCTMYVH